MERFKQLFFQGLRFSLVGIVNTVIDMAAYGLLVLIPFFNVHYTFANVISYSLGVVNSLFMNKRFTFREKERMGVKRVALFIAVNLVSMGVSTLALVVCRDTLLWGNALSKLAATAGSLVVNFTLNKLLVFKR